MNNLPTISINFGQNGESKNKVMKALLALIWWDKVKRQFKQTAIEHSVKRKRQERREGSELEEKLIKLQQQANTTGNDQDFVKYLQAKNDLKQLDLQELEGVKIRTKAEYTEKGEKSTRYFFSLEKRRQAEQTIKLLTKDNNETATEQKDILKEVHSYYKSLYSAEQTDPNAQEQILNIKTPTLAEEARQSLTKNSHIISYVKPGFHI